MTPDDSQAPTNPPAPATTPGAAPTAPAPVAVTPPDFGITESKLVLNFIVQLANNLDNALAGGQKLSIFSALKFYGALQAAIPAFNSIASLEPELAHLDPNEVAELISYAQQQLNFAGSDKELQAKVSAALSLGNEIYAFLKGQTS